MENLKERLLATIDEQNAAANEGYADYDPDVVAVINHVIMATGQKQMDSTSTVRFWIREYYEANPTLCVEEHWVANGANGHRRVVIPMSVIEDEDPIKAGRRWYLENQIAERESQVASLTSAIAGFQQQLDRLDEKRS